MEKIQLNSEIGKLNTVILHKPGAEIENMIPKNVERALYSDILNLSVALKEYSQFESVLKRYSNVYYVNDLLIDVLKQEDSKIKLLSEICGNESMSEICDTLSDVPPKELATMLIEGVIMQKNTLTKYLNDTRYSLRPLHNFFFMRDSAIAYGCNIFISKMASQVREREAKIMNLIFREHPLFQADTKNPYESDMINPLMSFEGGDVIVLNEDILLIGLSQRTSSYGIDYIIDHLNKNNSTRHVIVQELPQSPESFIHLDMTFTCLSENDFMVYKPLIIDSNHFHTLHITLDGGKVNKIEEENNIIKILNKLQFDVNPIYCGGNNDQYIQEREQWHSGTNFFALAPGKIIGYKRNVYTVEELNKSGYEVMEAHEIIDGIRSIDDYSKCVIVFEGSELARGGGGARCMTMPINRD